MGGLAARVFGSVHVGDLSNNQLAGHQLPAEMDHGAGAGVILFFTCVSAVLALLAMGAISDTMGNPAYGFVLARPDLRPIKSKKE
jgi:hypothetical protein